MMKQRVLPLVTAVALALAACGSDGDAVSVDRAWARATAAGQTTGAIYFDLTVDEDDTLVSAAVPSSVAAEAQIHEVVEAEPVDGGEMSGEMDESGGTAGSDDMDEMSDETDEMSGEDEMDGMDGAMRMQELANGLALTGGETVTFEPGGYHVMLLDLTEPLEAGGEVELTLEFAEAGSTTLAVEVAETAP